MITLPDGLRLDPTTVQLYKATVSGENDGYDEPTFTPGEEVATDWSFTNDPASNSFIVNLPDGAGSYLLTYSADVLDPDKKQSYTNKIAFNDQQLGGEETAGVVVPGGGGGGDGGAGSSKKGSIWHHHQGTGGKYFDEVRPESGGIKLHISARKAGSNPGLSRV